MKQSYLIIIAIALIGMAVITFSPITRRTNISNVNLTAASPAASVSDSNTNNEQIIESNPTAVSATSTPSASSTITSSGSYKNGTYKGSTSSNQFGDVNVSIIVSGGKITDITFNTMPDGDRKSAQISQQVAPILKSQALSAQSANIDGVSGATYTTNSYINSLQAAIDAAKV